MNTERENKTEQARLIISGINSLIQEIRVQEMTEEVETLVLLNLGRAEELLRDSGK